MRGAADCRDVEAGGCGGGWASLLRGLCAGLARRLAAHLGAVTATPRCPRETAPNLAGQPISYTGTYERARNPVCAPA